MFDFITNLTVEAILSIALLLFTMLIFISCLLIVAFTTVFHFIKAVDMLKTKNKRSLAREQSKKEKTLANDICEMSKANVPSNVMEEFVRSATTTNQCQNNKSLFHRILKAACETVLNSLKS